MTNSHFVCMSFIFKLRDLVMPPKSKLSEACIEPGSNVLDFGCGPGSFALAAAELVGKAGKIYALDIHPLAIQRVQELASKGGLSNIKTIRSDLSTGLKDNSIDAVLLYDTFHEISNPDGLLEELHRVLKPDSTLSFSDHHMKEDEIVSNITGRGLFKLSRKGKRTYSFTRVEPSR